MVRSSKDRLPNLPARWLGPPNCSIANSEVSNRREIRRDRPFVQEMVNKQNVDINLSTEMGLTHIEMVPKLHHVSDIRERCRNQDLQIHRCLIAEFCLKSS